MSPELWRPALPRRPGCARAATLARASEGRLGASCSGAAARRLTTPTTPDSNAACSQRPARALCSRLVGGAAVQERPCSGAVCLIECVCLPCGCGYRGARLPFAPLPNRDRGRECAGAGGVCRCRRPSLSHTRKLNTSSRRANHASANFGDATQCRAERTGGGRIGVRHAAASGPLTGLCAEASWRASRCPRRCPACAARGPPGG